MIYTVTYVGGKGEELSTFVEADTVKFDPHWVSFHRNQPPEVDVFAAGCDNCGRATTRPRTAFSHRTDIVAVYPAQRIRRVEESRRD